MLFYAALLPLLAVTSISATVIGRGDGDNVREKRFIEIDNQGDGHQAKIKLVATGECISAVDRILDHRAGATDDNGNRPETKSNYDISTVACNSKTAMKFIVGYDTDAEIQIVAPDSVYNNFVLDSYAEKNSTKENPNFGVVTLKKKSDHDDANQRWMFNKDKKRITLYTQRDDEKKTHCLSRAMGDNGAYLITAETCRDENSDEDVVPYINQEWEPVE